MIVRRSGSVFLGCNITGNKGLTTYTPSGRAIGVASAIFFRLPDAIPRRMVNGDVLKPFGRVPPVMRYPQNLPSERVRSMYMHTRTRVCICVNGVTSQRVHRGTITEADELITSKTTDFANSLERWDERWHKCRADMQSS